jgi:protein involved in polysaccharide export with SLBB domain
MLRAIRAVFIIVGMFAASGLSAQGVVAPDTAGGQFISPGDQIRIVVWRKPEMSGDFAVAGNGTILHPLYREVQVTGVPLSVVEDRLRTFLLRYDTNPQFVIQPLVRVIVGGEAKSPNIYSVPPETTVQQAVAMAGGPTDRGALDDVRMVRDRQEVRVDLSRPNSEAALLQIRSGDVILIGRRGTGIRDFVAPVASSLGLIASLITVFRR